MIMKEVIKNMNKTIAKKRIQGKKKRNLGNTMKSKGVFKSHNGYDIPLSQLYICIGLLIILAGSTTFFTTTTFKPTFGQQQEVVLSAMVAEPDKRWDRLFQDALVKLRERHPDMNITIRYVSLPYDDTRNQILTALSGQVPI